MHDVEHEAMTSFLRQTSSGGENIPHSSEVLERVMLYLGGVNGFAGCLVKQMFDSPQAAQREQDARSRTAADSKEHRDGWC